MATREYTPSRRTLLGHSMVALPLIAAATPVSAGFALSHLEADPLLGLIHDYREAAGLLNATEVDIDDNHPIVLREKKLFLRLCEDCPAPTTTKGAVEALRLALETEVEHVGHDDTISLLRGALGYLEAAA